MRAVVLAYGNVGCEGIEALLAGGVEIAAVFTHADRADENIWFRSVAELSARRELPTFAPDDINHPYWIEKIRDLEPDILFSFYYRELVGPAILGMPPAGCLNLHGSLLPAYRGRAPANWAILNGETVTGVTLHHMIEKADAGDIVCQQQVPIIAADDARTLNLKLAAEAGRMMRDILPRILDGSAPRMPQAPEKASYYGRRRPADGRIDWSRSAVDVHNLVRAVTHPYPGAFTFAGKDRITIWASQALPAQPDARRPGTLLASDPLDIACGAGVLRVIHAQSEEGVFCRGAQLADDLNLVAGTQLRSHPPQRRRQRKTRVLILGVNGFIGNFLSERLLESGRYEVHGMDLNDAAIRRLTRHADFHFHEGDIAIHSEWIEYQIRKCDLVVPLVAIATPIEYTRNPLRVFELDFEENLRIVRYCVRYGKRLVFPSTSEVYGMCTDREFDEDRSQLVLGPINKQRWIYSASKQLLDRVIWAYGQKEGLRFTLFRPFNWIGPRLDSLDSARIGSSRAITQLILNLVEGTPIQLIDGGEQKRCFTDVAEGIECLFRIIENTGDNCDGQIINIGNPDNEASIRDLAKLLTARFERHPLRKYFPPCAGLQVIESSRYYGDGYEDVEHRRPSIRNARRLLGWQPIIPLQQSVELTLDFFLREHLAAEGAASGTANLQPLSEMHGRTPMANAAGR